jgi:hypothetical protein
LLAPGECEFVAEQSAVEEFDVAIDQLAGSQVSRRTVGRTAGAILKAAVSNIAGDKERIRFFIICFPG